MSSGVAAAHLIRQEWETAAGQYCEALKRKKLTAHALESMRRQVVRILGYFRGLGIAIPPPFDNPDAFFAPPAATPGRADHRGVGTEKFPVRNR